MIDGGDAPALVLHHVQLAAPPGCEALARRFYCAVLGLAEVDKPPGLAGRGGIWFALRDGHQLHIGVQDAFVAAAKAHPALAADGVAALRTLAERLRSAGAPVRWDAALPGVTRFYTEDPFGNRLELLTTGIKAPTPGIQAPAAGIQAPPSPDRGE